MITFAIVGQARKQAKEPPPFVNGRYRPSATGQEWTLRREKGDPAMEKLDAVLAYKAMFRFLENYYERGGRNADEIAVLLSSMNMEIFQDGRTADPAMWDDWLDAIEEVLAVQVRQSD